MISTSLSLDWHHVKQQRVFSSNMSSLCFLQIESYSGSVVVQLVDSTLKLGLVCLVRQVISIVDSNHHSYDTAINRHGRLIASEEAPWLGYVTNKGVASVTLIRWAVLTLSTIEPPPFSFRNRDNHEFDSHQTISVLNLLLLYDSVSSYTGNVVNNMTWFYDWNQTTWPSKLRLNRSRSQALQHHLHSDSANDRQWLLQIHDQSMTTRDSTLPRLSSHYRKPDDPSDNANDNHVIHTRRQLLAKAHNWNWLTPQLTCFHHLDRSEYRDRNISECDISPLRCRLAFKVKAQLKSWIG
jgi:hypothetical protein